MVSVNDEPTIAELIAEALAEPDPNSSEANGISLQALINLVNRYLNQHPADLPLFHTLLARHHEAQMAEVLEIPRLLSEFLDSNHSISLGSRQVATAFEQNLAARLGWQPIVTPNTCSLLLNLGQIADPNGIISLEQLSTLIKLSLEFPAGKTQFISLFACSDKNISQLVQDQISALLKLVHNGFLVPVLASQPASPHLQIATLAELKRYTPLTNEVLPINVCTVLKRQGIHSLEILQLLPLNYLRGLGGIGPRYLTIIGNRFNIIDTFVPIFKTIKGLRQSFG